ncbi:MAG: urease accessory protein UreE [Cyanobacteria bacterium MAG APA_bin_95]|nr:urease accessory protein UreE [Cyanobacteria bacterium MAG APA_bin_95]
MSLTPVLSHRGASPHPVGSPQTMSLSAEARSKVRGRRTTDQGLDVVLQLPRTGPLQPGERLGCEQGQLVVDVVAAPEDLLAVEASTTLALLQAAYHLGNRHLLMEIQPRRLLIPADGVLRQMLEDRGLTVYSLRQAFYPEPGAYTATAHHGHGARGASRQ